MPSGGKDSGPGPDSAVAESLSVKVLKAVTSVAAALLVVALIALLFAPKDAGTLTLYGLVIGLNLLLFALFWPVVKWLQRLGQ